MKADDGAVKNISVSSNTLISRTDNGQRETFLISDVKSGDEINVMAQDISQSDITPRMIIIGTFTPPQRDSGYEGNGDQQQSTPDNNSAGINAI